MTICRQCKSQYNITPKDKDFYNRMNVPDPSLCPNCRVQRRYAFRNERSLYRRKCDLTGKSIISFHHPDKAYKVYDQSEWWSDKWDPLEYGRDFDFSKPFFVQFADLQKDVPRISMTVSHCENCEYAPYSVHSKNCYMCISCIHSEDLYYCLQGNYSRDCVDCSFVIKCELCYECLYCIGLFRSAFCKNCEDSSDIYFCQDCRGCKNCIGCKNLIKKEYYVFNEKVPKDVFDRYKADIQNFHELTKISRRAYDFFLTQPQRSDYLINCENCTGDNLYNCKNSFYAFDAKELEDCSYAYIVPTRAKDSQDINYSPDVELVYDSMSATNDYAAKFALHSWDVKESAYTDECFYSQNLFGCIGLKHKEYCILNRQYSKEEYAKLVPRIISHMTSTGEWGEFFPAAISPFGYNETIAQEHFPMVKEEVLKKDWKWDDFSNPPPKADKTIPASRLPDSTDKVPDDVLNWAIKCEATDKPFKITAYELRFYRNMNLPIPHLHLDERHKRRIALRNPRKLYDRKCAKCASAIRTTYSPDRPEKVYCEECYLKTVY